MGVYIGGIDPLVLFQGIINKLIQKGILTLDEAEELVRSATNPELLKQGKPPYSSTSERE